ncbi:hypothetical protein Tcan_06679 [Toxocara canis]|uniref:Uncharacterized protein n=1 Tax=Toxocara canis TaxID=6265 RepID=A0A0B2W4L2_TOXCA|nr:hypothetical protein Tcan_06679 [Toxocara canis]
MMRRPLMMMMIYSHNKLMGANGSRSTDDGSKGARCWSTSCRSRRFSNDEHYKPSGRPPVKPTRLEITKETGPVDPTLLSSTVLINSWKAPSTANMTPPITPISTDSSYSVEGFSLSQPTQETLMQIIRCFPFPTPTGSSENSPRCERKRQGKRAIVNEEASTTDATKPVERSKSLNAKKHIKASFTNVIRRKTEKLPGQFDGNGNSNASRSPPDANDVIRSRGALEKLAQVATKEEPQ